MEADSFYKIGWIAKPHGLKGEVTVMLESDSPDFSALGSVFLEQDQRFVPYFIESVSSQEKKAFVKFEDINSAEDARRITKHSVFVEKTLRPKSGRGEFYDDEVIGFEVMDKEKGKLGEIVGVMQAGPNRLLVLEQRGKEILIPVNGPFITAVNKSKKFINVELPDGFLDI